MAGRPRLGKGRTRASPTWRWTGQSAPGLASSRARSGRARRADYCWGAPLRGAGDVAVVFLHCWACNRDYWRHQVGPVAEAGYRVVALDLPGHGASAAAERAEWTLPGLGADVEAVIRDLGLERVVLVGHSMGGPVALETAARMPGTVAGIVGVDTLHDAEFVFPEGMVESLTAQLEADYRAGIEAFLEFAEEERQHLELLIREYRLLRKKHQNPNTVRVRVKAEGRRPKA